MKLCIMGTGYVGLVTGTCLADLGNEVICISSGESKINLLKQGKVPIYEPDLDELIEKNVKENRLFFDTDSEKSIQKSEIIFICKGTPSQPNGQVNLKYVEDAAIEIGRAINNYKIIVNKSTVPIGSGDWVSMIINDEQEKLNKNVLFDVVSCPEFLREGSAIYDVFFTDRIVIGSSSKRAIETMKKLYKPIMNQTFETDLSPRPKNKVPLVITDLTSAEMIKYAANSFLATKISFINEIASICEKVGADVTKVADGIGLDKRIGREFLNAGLGWGGSCFPKDLSAISQIAAEYGLSTQIINAVVQANKQQRSNIIKKAQELLKILKGKTIGVLGISFKPNTDDTRYAPAITIINNLIKLGVRVKVYDPIVKNRPMDLSEKVLFCKDAYDVADNSHLLILATEWDEFIKLDFEKIKKSMINSLIIDGRNVLDKEKLINLGFTYIGIGR
ncbi:MAG: UDP-glucose/GDP-mannose dehydrogenase family protein [Actinobacteria bacterium]|nr:UDP-glucose/GDP-mannose dehydrogenase family protein [Actinomycetota bacterium]